MKLICTILAAILFLGIAHADDSKYVTAMKKNITKLDSAKSFNDFLDVSNNFERIAFSEKDKWLPYYYAALANTIASYADTSGDKKDIYLDKATSFIQTADSLQQNESEIYTLKGMIAQARMQVDPMSRWQKYGAEATQNFQKATELDSLNPRPDYLVGVGTFYTPEQFGGGPAKAKPILERSLAKYEKFVPKDELMPVWGKQSVEQYLGQIH